MRLLSRWREEQPLCQPSCSYTFELEGDACSLVSTGKQLRQERQKLHQLFASLGSAALCNLGLLVRCLGHAALNLMCRQAADIDASSSYRMGGTENGTSAKAILSNSFPPLLESYKVIIEYSLHAMITT